MVPGGPNLLSHRRGTSGGTSIGPDSQSTLSSDGSATFQKLHVLFVNQETSNFAPFGAVVESVDTVWARETTARGV
jgi:hypothetical protein